MKPEDHAYSFPETHQIFKFQVIIEVLCSQIYDVLIMTREQTFH